MPRTQRRISWIAFLKWLVTQTLKVRLAFSNEPCRHLCVARHAGIDCPRGARNGPQGLMEADPYSDEALALTKEQCMHREVRVFSCSAYLAFQKLGFLSKPVFFHKESCFQQSNEARKTIAIDAADFAHPLSCAIVTCGPANDFETRIATIHRSVDRYAEKW